MPLTEGSNTKKIFSRIGNLKLFGQSLVVFRSGKKYIAGMGVEMAHQLSSTQPTFTLCYAFHPRRLLKSCRISS